MFDINPRAIAVEGVGYDPLTMTTLGWIWVSGAVVSPNADVELMLARIRRRRGSSSQDNEDFLRTLVVFVESVGGNVPGIEQFWSIHGHTEQVFVATRSPINVLAENVTPEPKDEDIVIEEAEVTIV